MKIIRLKAGQYTGCATAYYIDTGRRVLIRDLPEGMLYRVVSESAGSTQICPLDKRYTVASSNPPFNCSTDSWVWSSAVLEVQYSILSKENK